MMQPRYFPKPARPFHGISPISGQETRKGDFTSLASGRQFWPLDPRPEEIDIKDIARALSMQCRWGGHVNRFYSVAQHCILVSEHCPAFPLTGLLHDAAEAYLVDVPTPIKKHLAGYVDIEQNLLLTIGAAFNVFNLTHLPAEVKLADSRALATEQRDLRPRYDFWEPPAAPWVEPIFAMQQTMAERAFLQRFTQLTGVRP